MDRFSEMITLRGVRGVSRTKRVYRNVWRLGIYRVGEWRDQSETVESRIKNDIGHLKSIIFQVRVWATTNSEVKVVVSMNLIPEITRNLEKENCSPMERKIRKRCIRIEMESITLHVRTQYFTDTSLSTILV